jgi:hypothetical protein
MAIKILRVIGNIPAAFFFAFSLFYNSFKEYSLCKEKKKEHQCFFFTRGCESCLTATNVLSSNKIYLESKKVVLTKQSLGSEQYVHKV